MTKLKQVSLPSTANNDVIPPSISYLVVATLTLQGCVFELRRCWAGWVFLWVVLWMVQQNVARFKHFEGESKTSSKTYVDETMPHPHIASAPHR
jgi:hypothetical protein